MVRLFVELGLDSKNRVRCVVEWRLTQRRCPHFDSLYEIVGSILFTCGQETSLVSSVVLCLWHSLFASHWLTLLSTIVHGDIIMIFGHQF